MPTETTVVPQSPYQFIEQYGTALAALATSSVSYATRPAIDFRRMPSVDGQYDVTASGRPSIAIYEGYLWTTYVEGTSGSQNYILGRIPLSSGGWQQRGAYGLGWEGFNLNSIAGDPLGSRGTDSHNFLSLAFCPDGKLRVVGNMHNTTFQGVVCSDISGWDNAGNWAADTLPDGAPHTTSCTYPDFHPLPSGNVFFSLREGAFNNGQINHYLITKEGWEYIGLFLTNTGTVGAYPLYDVDPTGRIHATWPWATGDAYGNDNLFDVIYAYSDDEGSTWKRSSGRQYTTPIEQGVDEDIVKNIPTNSNLVGANVIGDANGTPYVLYYVPSSTQPSATLTLSNSTGTVNVTNSAGAWTVDVVGSRITTSTGTGIIVSYSSAALVQMTVNDNFGGLSLPGTTWSLWTSTNAYISRPSLDTWAEQKVTEWSYFYDQVPSLRNNAISGRLARMQDRVILMYKHTRESRGRIMAVDITTGSSGALVPVAYLDPWQHTLPRIAFDGNTAHMCLSAGTASGSSSEDWRATELWTSSLGVVISIDSTQVRYIIGQNLKVPGVKVIADNSLLGNTPTNTSFSVTGTGSPGDLVGILANVGREHADFYSGLLWQHAVRGRMDASGTLTVRQRLMTADGLTQYALSDIILTTTATQQIMILTPWLPIGNLHDRFPRLSARGHAAVSATSATLSGWQCRVGMLDFV